MQTSLIAALCGTISFVVAFILGRWTSTASAARRRYSNDAGKPPLWLKNYKSNAYTKTIYEKIQKYFEESEPYLDPAIGIEKVARAVGTNKSYVAKAVKVYSGRNFCQFVNSYRVDHARKLFRENSTLRVNQLAARSGFNSATSFSIAFKIVTGMPPGEWCRRYKDGLRP